MDPTKGQPNTSTNPATPLLAIIDVARFRRIEMSMSWLKAPLYCKKAERVQRITSHGSISSPWNREVKEGTGNIQPQYSSHSLTSVEPLSPLYSANVSGYRDQICCSEFILQLFSSSRCSTNSSKSTLCHVDDGVGQTKVSAHGFHRRQENFHAYLTS